MHSKEIRTIDDLKQFLKEFFQDTKVEIYLFGSRARGDHVPYSDIDIGFVSKDAKDISGRLTALREILEESHLPYKVDLVEIAEDSQLLDVVRKEGIRWV